MGTTRVKGRPSDVDVYPLDALTNEVPQVVPSRQHATPPGWIRVAQVGDGGGHSGGHFFGNGHSPRLFTDAPTGFCNTVAEGIGTHHTGRAQP